MTFLNPLALAGLTAVAVAAAIALFRPGRQVVIVSTLHLWRQALETAEAGPRRRRVLTLSWILLLAGALSAMLAMARPVVTIPSPGRYVAVTLVPCGELANAPGMDNLRGAARQLLQRLGPADRVQLVLPTRLGGPSGRLTRDEALSAVRAIAPVAAPAETLTLPQPDPQAQHIYRIGPANLNWPDSPKSTNIPLATTTPPVTLQALAGTRLGDGASQVLVAMKNHSAQPSAVTLTTIFDAAPGLARSVSLAPGERRGVPIDVPPGVTKVAVSLGDMLGQRAALVAVERPTLRVAVIGRDDPALRRLLGAMPGVVQTGNPAGCDAVIAVGADLPADKAGIALNPPSAPPGWHLAEQEIGPVALAQASTLADAPLLASVDLANVAVRRVRPFLATPSAGGEQLVTIPAGALILAQDRPRRLYVAFSPATSDTNWSLDPSFPILLDNVMEWLSPASRLPLWHRPGDSADALGLGYAIVNSPNVAAAALPTPTPAPTAIEFWPWLAGLAGLLWLAGWWQRTREGGARWRV